MNFNVYKCRDYFLLYQIGRETISVSRPISLFQAVSQARIHIKLALMLRPHVHALNGFQKRPPFTPNRAMPRIMMRATRPNAR